MNAGVRRAIRGAVLVVGVLLIAEGVDGSDWLVLGGSALIGVFAGSDRP